MMDLLELKEYLLGNGIDTNISIGTVIDGNGIGLFSTSGFSPIYYSDGSIHTREGLQIISRHTSYLEGEKAINDAFVLLNELQGYKAEQMPFFIGRDEKGRSEFSVNFIILNKR